MNLIFNVTASDNSSGAIRPETETERMKFKIAELRQECFKAVQSSPGDFDPRDVAVLDAAETGFTLFLESNDWKVDSALEAIKRHCTYRKEHGILDLKMSHIPKEVHQIGLFMAKGCDRSGHPLFYIRLSISPGPSELHPIIKRKFLLECESVRNQVLACNKKLAIIFDCRSAQVDIGLLREILDIYTQKYPPAAEYIAFLDMNFGFKMILQVIKYFFPKYLWKKMIFIDQETLKTLVDPDNLPTYLGGAVEPLSKSETSQCSSLAQYAKAHSIDDKSYTKMITHLNKQINSASK